jgi:methionyl-tRNA formyltransferase
MRVYILTQEDSFYIPRMLDHVLTSRFDVVAVGLVPGEIRSGNTRRYLEMMGLRDFALQAARLVLFRVLDLVARVVPLSASYSVAGAARRRGVPLEPVPKINNPEFVESLRRRDVDIVVSIACPQVFRKELLAAPSRGCINIHGALLPRYQGLLPSFWVLAKGERETGVTVHYIDEQIDHGDIILQRKVVIKDDDTMHRLILRSKVEVGKNLLVEALEQLERGTVRRQPLDLAQASYFSYPDAAAVQEFRSRGRRFI